MLTEELRTIILKITEDPLYVKPSAIDIPLKLNRRLREYFITQLRTRKDKYAAQIFNEQIRYDELDKVLKGAYQYLVDKCGISTEEELYRFLKLLIGNILRQQGKREWAKREELENPVDEAIFQSIRSFSRGSEYENIPALIEYGKQNSLFHWNGEKWRVTNLGLAFIKLSSMQAVKFLLLLELHQSGGKDDVWHVSRNYLEWIYTTKEYFFDYPPNEIPEIYLGKWLRRLIEMGIIEFEIAYEGGVGNFQYDVGYIIKVTKFGEVILEIILDSESDPLSTFVEMLYRQELNFSPDLLSYYSNSETIEKLRGLFLNSEIVKGQGNEIKAGLKSFQDMNYISSLKTFIPSIEGVVRNIYVDKSIGGTDKDLEPMLDQLQSNRWITKETRALVISLGRTKKVHGLEGLFEQEAQIYCMMTLKALEDIHKNFYFFTALRMCFKKIAEKEPHIPTGSLLSAYPKKRDEVHLQVKEHLLDTNYKKIELLCTLPKHKKVYECKADLEKNNIEISESPL